jgi:hypothetical protein
LIYPLRKSKFLSIFLLMSNDMNQLVKSILANGLKPLLENLK